MTRAELETELAKLVAELAPGGVQAHCESLRRKIAQVERALAHEPQEKGPRYD
jgi:ribosomal protein L29